LYTRQEWPNRAMELAKHGPSGSLEASITSRALQLMARTLDGGCTYAQAS
jgi:hypothetical protein